MFGRNKGEPEIKIEILNARGHTANSIVRKIMSWELDTSNATIPTFAPPLPKQDSSSSSGTSSERGKKSKAGPETTLIRSNPGRDALTTLGKKIPLTGKAGEWIAVTPGRIFIAKDVDFGEATNAGQGITLCELFGFCDANELEKQKKESTIKRGDIPILNQRKAGPQFVWALCVQKQDGGYSYQYIPQKFKKLALRNTYYVNHKPSRVELGRLVIKPDRHVLLPMSVDDGARNLKECEMLKVELDPFIGWHFVQKKDSTSTDSSNNSKKEKNPSSDKSGGSSGQIFPLDKVLKHPFSIQKLSSVDMDTRNDAQRLYASHIQREGDKWLESKHKNREQKITSSEEVRNTLTEEKEEEEEGVETGEVEDITTNTKPVNNVRNAESTISDDQLIASIVDDGKREASSLIEKPIHGDELKDTTKSSVVKSKLQSPKRRTSATEVSISNSPKLVSSPSSSSIKEKRGGAITAIPTTTKSVIGDDSKKKRIKLDRGDSLIEDKQKTDSSGISKASPTKTSSAKASSTKISPTSTSSASKTSTSSNVSPKSPSTPKSVSLSKPESPQQLPENTTKRDDIKTNAASKIALAKAAAIASKTKDTSSVPVSKTIITTAKPKSTPQEKTATSGNINRGKGVPPKKRINDTESPTTESPSDKRRREDVIKPTVLEKEKQKEDSPSTSPSPPSKSTSTSTPSKSTSVSQKETTTTKVSPTLGSTTATTTTTTTKETSKSTSKRNGTKRTNKRKVDTTSDDSEMPPPKTLPTSSKSKTTSTTTTLKKPATTTRSTNSSSSITPPGKETTVKRVVLSISAKDKLGDTIKKIVSLPDVPENRQNVDLSILERKDWLQVVMATLNPGLFFEKYKDLSYHRVAGLRGWLEYSKEIAITLPELFKIFTSAIEKENSKIPESSSLLLENLEKFSPS